MRSVIVVADDLGLSSAVNRATGALLAEAMLSLPSLLIGAPATDEAVALLRAHHARHVGLHLNLTEAGFPAACGRPSELTDEKACYRGLSYSLERLIGASAELRAWLREEIAEQRDQLLSFGFSLSHIAGHHHIHVLPAVREAVSEVFGGSRPFVRGYESVPHVSKPGVRPHLIEFGASTTAWYRERGFPVTSTLGLHWSQHPSRDAIERDLEALQESSEYSEWMVHAAQYRPGDALHSMERSEELEVLRQLLGAEGRSKMAVQVVAPEELDAVVSAHDDDGVKGDERIRLLLLAPVLPPSSRGNAVTVRRLLKQLHDSGVLLRCVESDEFASMFTRSPNRWNLIHGFHLVRSAAAVAAFGDKLPCPYVLTQTGTDLSPDLKSDTAYVRFLCGAAAIIFPHEAAKREFARRYPEVTVSRCCVIPKSLEPFPEREPLAADTAKRLAGKQVILLPAHIRPVKGIETALEGFTNLLRRVPAEQADLLVLVVAGRVLDEEYAASLRLESAPQVLHIECSRSQMPALYEASSIVINTSHTEGSPNAVLEALMFGRPVVGRAIPGLAGIAELACAVLGPLPKHLKDSDWPVQLFESANEHLSLSDALAVLIGDPGRRARLSENARRAFSYLADQRREAAAYLEVYHRASRRAGS